MSPDVTSTDRRSRANRRFAGHFLEMLAAMFVGMMALAPAWSLIPGLPDRPEVDAMVMATNMTVGMVVWMAVRRHSRARIAEMAAVMYLSFIALLVPYWLGAISGETVMMGGHLLMIPAMLAVMLWRRTEYSKYGNPG